MVGTKWFSEFLKRHPILMQRKPEGRSINIASGFDKTNVNLFLI